MSRGRRERWREWSNDKGYAAGWRMVRALPEPAARRLFAFGADIAVRGGGPPQLCRNLARVLGTAPEEVPDQLIRESLRSYARYWREAFRLPTLDHAALATSGRIEIAGLDRVAAAMAAGRGVVLVLPHSGNWDIAGMWLVQHYGSFTTVAERLRPESLFRRFVAYRESLGFEVFPLTGGEQPPFRTLAERLRDGRVVCLLGERDLTGRGVPVTFFGERTWLPAGPVRLAQEVGAVLLPVHCWFTTDTRGREGWGNAVGEPLDTSGELGAVAQRLADCFATGIAAHPADWHMLQPLWESDLTARQRARITAATSPTED